MSTGRHRSSRRRPDVAIAEFSYRHEAEFASGFLDHAEIPYRLQVDDAGGADAGVTIARPAVLWVRAEDAERARELLHPEEDDSDAADSGVPDDDDGEDDDDRPRGTFIPTTKTDTRRLRLPDDRRLPPGEDRPGAALCGVERAVSAVLSVALLGLVTVMWDGLADSTLTAVWLIVLVVLAAALAISAVLGRTLHILKGILRGLSGVGP